MFFRKQVCGPGLSCITKLSKYQNINAKNVTNLLILLSVLGGRSFIYFKTIQRKLDLIVRM